MLHVHLKVNEVIRHMKDNSGLKEKIHKTIRQRKMATNIAKYVRIAQKVRAGIHNSHKVVPPAEHIARVKTVARKYMGS